MWKILICDDESLTRKGLSKMLSHLRDDITIVKTAADGLQATQLIQELQPSIVFIDINMPKKTGLEVIAQFHEKPNLRFVIISGYSDFEYAQKACRYHVVDYLLKPITEEDLAHVLKRCIDSLQTQINTSQIFIPQHQDRKMINQIVQEMDTHFKECEFSLNQLSSQFHVSSSYLSKVIKQEMKCTFSEYITNKRLEYAKELLLSHQNYMLWEISEKCGFTSQHYFCRVFKNQSGISPTQYRQMIQKKSEF